MSFVSGTRDLLLITRVLLFLASFSLAVAVVCIILKIKVYKTLDCLTNVAWIFPGEAGKRKSKESGTDSVLTECFFFSEISRLMV